MVPENLSSDASDRRARDDRHALVGCARLLVFGLAAFAASVQAGELPRVSVSSIRRVFHNGEHNAFTDLVRYQGVFYLTFRSCPDGHMVHPTASIIILSSDDAQEWNEVHRFRVAKRDTRDPHFLVFQDKLFVYTGTWYSGATTLRPEDYDLNKHLGYAAWTADGRTWHSPVMLDGTFGHYVWRANTFAGKAYLCGRRKQGFEMGAKGEGREVESVMLESDDGLIWRKRALFQEVEGDETAFLFESDGRLIAIGRRGRGTAQLLQVCSALHRVAASRPGPRGRRAPAGSVGRALRGRRPQDSRTRRTEDLAVLACGRCAARVRRVAQRRRQLLSRLRGTQPNPGDRLLVLFARERRERTTHHRDLHGEPGNHAVTGIRSSRQERLQDFTGGGVPP